MSDLARALLYAVFDVSLYCEALNCDGGWLYLQVPPACLEDGPADAPLNARYAGETAASCAETHDEEAFTVRQQSVSIHRLGGL